MNVTEDIKTFSEACLDTAFGAVCVKSRDRNGTHQFGRVVQPTITSDMITGESDLHRLIEERDKVVVRGHGWDGEKPFVWRGTGSDFHYVWELD